MNHQMPIRSGRLEKRTRLAIPVRILNPQEPTATEPERTTTENICSLGIRVVVSRYREPNEELLINSADGDLQTYARVVYCQPLSDGRFAVGLQFPEETSLWMKKNSVLGTE